MSIKQAVNSHCKGCIYDPAEQGTWREQVENCTITKCELYEYRPITAKTKRFNDEKKLAMLSDDEREIVLKKRAEMGEKLRNSRN